MERWASQETHKRAKKPPRRAPDEPLKSLYKKTIFNFMFYLKTTPTTAPHFAKTLIRNSPKEFIRKKPANDLRWTH